MISMNVHDAVSFKMDIRELDGTLWTTLTALDKNGKGILSVTYFDVRGIRPCEVEDRTVVPQVKAA